jgi:hypothetical protein
MRKSRIAALFLFVVEDGCLGVIAHALAGDALVDPALQGLVLGFERAIRRQLV